MVHLVTVRSTFEARVIAARLGSEGVVAQLRGAVDGPYPFGDVMVEVREDDLDTARELLLADQVESAFLPPPPARPAGPPLRAWLAAGAIVVITVVSVAARFL